MWEHLPVDLQERIHVLATRASHGEVMDELKRSVSHTTFWDNGAPGDDYAELSEAELRCRGWFKEARLNWNRMSYLRVCGNRGKRLAIYWHDPRSFNSTPRGFVEALYCWSEATMTREVQLRHHPRERRVVVEVSERSGKN